MRQIDAKSAMLGFGFGTVATAIAFAVFFAFAGTIGLVGESRVLEAANQIEKRNAERLDNAPPLVANGNVIWLDGGGVPSGPSLGRLAASPTAPSSTATIAASPLPTPVSANTPAPTIKPIMEATPAPYLGPTTEQPPTTEPPTTEPPATESPTTEPPTTEPPATEPPTTETPTTEPPATESPTLRRTIASIEIRRGDTATIVANKLQDAGIIDGTAHFLNRLAERRLTGEINIGDFELEAGMDVDAIINIISVRR